MPSEKREEPMNRISWQAQKVIRDIEEWRHWVLDGTEKFLEELKTLQNKKDMPTADKVNIAAVREHLSELKKSHRPLERAVHKATGRRIQRAQK